MSRRFALLFISTFIAVSFVRVPAFVDLVSAPWSALSQSHSASASIVLPSIFSAPLLEPFPSASSPVAAASSLPVSVRYDFYPIAGATATELRRQMMQQSPVSDAEGRSFDALTSWEVYWNFRYRRTGKGCAARSVNTRLNVVFTLPQWKIPRSASSELQTEWNDYIQALKLHEEGHKKNGVDAAEAVLRALHQLPEYPNCQQLEKAAKQTADQVIAIFNQRDVEYDRATAHGRTQGAVFPIAHAASVPDTSS